MALVQRARDQMPSNALPSHVFREYDIRGKAYDDIDLTFCYWLGSAFGEKVRAGGCEKVVVGRDNRHSSPDFHRALICGLQEAGCQVVDIGEVSTPMFYFALEHLRIPDGIMITASHNPGGENGFKIAMNYSTIYGEAIQKLRRSMRMRMEKLDAPAHFRWSASRLKRVDIDTAYLDMLKEKITFGPRKLKVVADCGNGTPSPFVPRALRNWGCEVVELYCQSDPDFPNHHPDPVDPANLRDLIDKVREEKADLGIAFDGDGDRLGVVDEQGNVLWGDQLMILFWREILPRYPGCTALIEVKCSQALVEEVKRLGGKPVFHRTGHSHIKASMKKMNVPFSGEMSGHLFFRDEYYGFDDALYAAGRLLRILSHTGRPLSALFADVPRYFSTPETRVPCADDAKQRVMSKIKQFFQGKRETIDVDGVRVLFPHGWGLIRCSNTQPILVLRAEADTEAGLGEIKSELMKALHSCSGGLQVNVNW